MSTLQNIDGLELERFKVSTMKFNFDRYRMIFLTRAVENKIEITGDVILIIIDFKILL